MFTNMMVSLPIRTIAMLPQVDKERYWNMVAMPATG